MTSFASGFGFVPTAAMYRCEGEANQDPVWGEGVVTDLADIALSPAAAVLSYGLGVFEGLKAERADDGRVLLFRVRDHARRLAHSARMLLMPPFPEERAVEAFVEIARRNAEFVPAARAGALYLRPMQYCVEPMLGGRPGRRFQLLVYASPVGPFFAKETGLRLRASAAARCAPGGTGSAKAIGNYASALATVSRWREEGYDDALFLDARRSTLVTETSGANVFARLGGGDVVTPALTDEILPGITRDGCLTLLREELGIAPRERELPLEEVLDDASEVFCTGTGWGVRTVQSIHDGRRDVAFGSSELARELDDRLRELRTGADDRYGWTTEVA